MKNYLILILVAVGVTSCNYTDGINENPNEFTSVPSDLLIPQGLLEVVKISSSNSSRYAGMFTNQMTGSDRQYIAVNNYNVTTSDFDDMWDDIFVDGITPVDVAGKSSLESGDKTTFGITQIIKGMLFAEAAALYGDIPFSEALNVEEYRNPKYESQIDVLNSSIEIIMDGVSKVGSSKVSAFYGGSVFVNNDATWAAVGNSLIARYKLVLKDYDGAYEYAKKGINSIDQSLLSTHGTADGSENLYWQFEVEQRGGYLTANNSYLNKMLSGDVTRLLSTPGDEERVKYYFNGQELNVSDGGVFSQTSSFPVIDFYETKLIAAEAGARTGKADALDLFNEVRDALAVKYSSDFPHSTSSGDDLVKEVLEEKYCTLLGSLQVFHDLRRTDNLIEIPTKTGSNHMQRFLYPTIEVNSNSNFPGVADKFAKTRVNGGSN